jgi:cell division transport system ATP-binding protein
VRATDTVTAPQEDRPLGEPSPAVRPQILERQRRGAHAKPLRSAAPVRDSRDTVVEFRGVSKLYGPGGIGLERATFAVRRQEMVFLVGPTGSGKSTIMRLLIKELEPSDGRIRVAGRDLADIERKKVPYYRRNVGVVFQDFKLLPTRTVYDNIAYALQVTGASRKQIRSTLPDILRLTGLSTKLHNYPHQLSGGEQQRVAVARAFASHPPLLLADEPTGALDTASAADVKALLTELNADGQTILLVTHDVSLAEACATRTIELVDGSVVRDVRHGPALGRRDQSPAVFGAPNGRAR